MSESLFDTKPAEPSSFDKLVEAKGEQWKDPDMIAKGYLAAQEHILKTEAELTKAKEAEARVAHLEGLLKEMEKEKSKPASGEPAPVSNTSSPEGTPTPTSEEDIKALLEKTLAEREASRTSEQNISETQRMLKEEFGTEAVATLEAKAKELGMSKEEIDQLAAKSPTAVMTLMGKAPTKQTNSVPKGEVNTIGFENTSGKRDYKWYQEQRRKNKKAYYTPEFQAQLMKDMEEQGSAFGL